MRWSEIGGRRDSMSRTMDVVGERWTLLILQEIFLGVRRFEELSARLGVARNILAARLQRLVQHRILVRVRYHERPPRYEYRLTERGLDLFPVILVLMKWGDRWLATDGPSVRPHHVPCDQVADPVLRCAHCGGAIGHENTRAVPTVADTLQPPGGRKARAHPGRHPARPAHG